jgi:hypothetical protein
LLGRSRGYGASPAATYAVVWANLEHDHPRLRTLLIAGASERDDATAAAVGLAEAAVRAGRGPETSSSSVAEGGGRVLVIVLGPAQRLVVESPVPSVRMGDAHSPAEVRTLLSDTREEFGLAIVVAPAPQTGPDCISLAGAADAAVLVATSGRTRFGDAQLAASLLRQVGVTPSAALLLTERGLRKRSRRADTAGVQEDGRRVGYGERPAPPEVAG